MATFASSELLAILAFRLTRSLQRETEGGNHQTKSFLSFSTGREPAFGRMMSVVEMANFDCQPSFLGHYPFA